ncbi:hypothetical protein E1B28_002571 [Marasmius oreades]|uniref:SWIM-type domain-containing protein n=1 Tax=Marasmius oreades TaxID=181124 RepID=A0A9P7UP34_9AGAR|nr:uncharacterized protein E1B28_002571 [Marasmius oreades]KAG7086629.1 hypothetical protein E1B28_002571 [Marasmius oreades]
MNCELDLSLKLDWLRACDGCIAFKFKLRPHSVTGTPSLPETTMSTDELAEIDGIKPNVNLVDGEETEVKSKSSKGIYKVKRTFDHYYCTCPAWRNQAGNPVNARSCKHLQSLLGEDYEAARIKLKNPDGQSRKGATSKKPASKVRGGAKRQKVEEEDKEEDKVEKKPKSKGKARATVKAKEDNDEEEMEENNDSEKKPRSKGKARAPAKRKKDKAEEKEEQEDELQGKPRSRGGASAKRNKGEGDEEEGDEEQPKARGRAPVKRQKKEEKDGEAEKPKNKGKGREPAEQREDKEHGGEDDQVNETAEVGNDETKAQNDMDINNAEHDELANFDGIKPKVMLADGEETEIKSQNSKSTYKVKRTGDHYYCNCPAWRNQSKKPVNARTCKHLQTLLGEVYEEARIKFKASNPEPAKAPPSKKPASKLSSKPTSTKAQGKPQSKPQSASKGKRKREEEEEEEEEEEGEGEEMEESETDELMDTGDDKVASNSDELAEINGIKPNVLLADGGEREVQSQTSNSVYKIKRTWDHYYCTCPAWRNQGGVPVNARTCKHLQSLLGDKYEAARIQLKNPDGPQPGSSRPKRAKKAKDDNGTTAVQTPQVLLANKWDLEKGIDPTGWWISEKLDGVRTYYDGKRMLSRLGNPFTPPQWFLDKLPKDVTLDGELFGGRREFQSTVSVVKTVNSPHWKNITFQVFDIPSHGNKPFEARIKLLKDLFGENGSHASEHVVVVEHEQAKGRDHVLEKLKEIESLGGEGLMLRKPKSQYEGHRSSTLLKVKTFYDAEAIVTGYAAGHGKNANVTGALKCGMESGKTFNVGSGLTDKQRKDPPKVGAIITYRFQELTKDGVPRFPTFVGEAVDKKKPKDAEVPEHRKAAVKKSSDDE